MCLVLSSLLTLRGSTIFLNPTEVSRSTGLQMAALFLLPFMSIEKLLQALEVREQT